MWYNKVVIPQTLHQQQRERAVSMSNTKRVGCLILFALFALFALAVLFGLVQFGTLQRVSMIALDTSTWEMQTLNCAPKGYEYREVFLAGEDDHFVWGSLHGVNGKGSTLYKHDLDTGEVVDTIELPPLESLGIQYGRHTVFFPKTMDLVCFTLYQELTTTKSLGPTEIYKYNIKTNTKEVLYGLGNSVVAHIFYVNNDTVLVFAEGMLEGEESIQIQLLDINTKEKKDVLSPDYRVCEAVSPGGKYVLLFGGGTLSLACLDHDETRILDTQSATDDFLYWGSFNQSGKKVVYSRGTDLYLFDIESGVGPELILSHSTEYRLDSPRFLDDTTIVFKRENTVNPSMALVFFDLTKKKTVKEIYLSSISSQLWIVGKYVLYME